jgi:hypothetical protein
MNISRMLKLIAFTVVLSACVPIVSAQETNLVSGRVVDDQGAPVSGALVTLYAPPCRNCFEHVLPGGRSLSDGAFFVDVSGGSLKNLSLFISEPVPAGFWSPLGEPSLEELSHPQIFRGIPIRIRKGTSRLNLGDVAVMNRYARVILDLSKMPLEENRSGADASMQVDLTLFDSRRRVIFSGLLPSQAFDPSARTVNLALPRGRWILEFRLDGHGKKISSVHSVRVKEFSTPIRLVF